MAIAPGDDVAKAESPTGSREARAVTSASGRWLEQHGGAVLLVVGAVLIGLAVWRADKPAVAPLLTVFGAGMILLGAFYSRIEGSVEATKDGIKAVVREVERVAPRDMSPDEFASLLSLAVERFDLRPRRATQVLDAARQAADEAATDPEASPIILERRLAQYATLWLTREGWAVEDYTMAGPDFEYDLLATRDGERLWIDLRLARYRPVSAALVERAGVLRDRNVRGGEGSRAAIVIGRESLAPTQEALEKARELNVEIYRVGAGEDVEVFVGPRP